MPYLDSIVFECETIVLAEVIASESNETPRVKIRVLECLLGNLLSEQNDSRWIRVSLDDFEDLSAPPYRRAGISEFHEGAHQYVFLVRDDSDHPIGVPTATAAIGHGRVNRFAPGNGSPHYAYNESMDLEPFQTTLVRAIQESKKLKRFINEGPRSREDFQAEILTRYKKRAALYTNDESGYQDHDAIAECLAAAAANLHEARFLDQMLELNLPGCLTILRWGFHCPEGRDYLLEKILDVDIGEKRRREYISIIAADGAEYFTISRVRSGNCNFDLLEGENNGRYLQRIAEAATVLRDEDTLCAELIRALSNCIRPVRIEENSIRPDVNEALSMLARTGSDFSGPRSLYELEILLYTHGKRPGGTVRMVTLVRGGKTDSHGRFLEYESIRGEPSEIVPFEIRSFNFHPLESPPPADFIASVSPDLDGNILEEDTIALLWAISNPNHEKSANCEHCLEHEETGRFFQVKQEDELFIVDGLEKIQDSRFRLPPDAPPGEYHHELRVLDEEGHVINMSFAYPLFILEASDPS